MPPKRYYGDYFDWLQGDPVVHKATICVKFKDGSERKDRPGVAFVDEAEMRERAEEWCENLRNGSKSEEIEEVYYRTRMISIE